MLRASPVPRQRQTALQKVTALFCACVSLVSENRSEGADLWAFLVHHGLQPAPVGSKMAHAAHDADPLETTVRLAVTYGLQPVVSFSSHGTGASGRYHHLDISDDYNTWQVTRQSMIKNNDLSSFVSERISVLVPPLEKDAVLELSADVIFTESEVAVFLAQVNKSLEESKQIIAFWTTIKDMGNYSKNSVSSAVTPSVLSAAENLTEDVRAALKRALLSSSWLRGTTRTKALSKAAAMAVTLGFPNRFSRESQLDQYFATLDDVRPDKSLSSWLALRHFLQEQQRRAGGDDADVAVTHAHKVNAYYLSGNRLLVPAGIIQEPVYFHDAADAYNYGALGQAVGHEMMHAYDTNGRKFDHHGRPWAWTITSAREYQQRLQCIRRSHVEVEQKRLALELGVGEDPENLADFSAASLAYDAFRSLPDHRRALTVHGFGSEQLFFIGHCVKWCRSLTVHRSPGYARGRSRCIVPLMHMPQFSAAFGCSANAYMNAPSKCSFW
ncbi:neprilysin-1-like [Dermacentor andersoni]|uniref:neprilysin-1-like n=1 Tax=Dermacentor andersoni TaxID=34620 RepID=UPI003B3BAABF